MLKFSPTCSTYDHFELTSTSSYRNFFLRQYFIDLLNISHSSLIQSMLKTHRLTIESMSNKNRERRHLTNKSFTSTPSLTLHPIKCLLIDNKKVQSTFQWFHSIETLSSIELIYHMDSTEIKQSSIPIQISIKQSHPLMEFLVIDTYLQIDPIRDFYFVNIYDYVLHINKPNFIIETIIENETCESSNTYIILSSSAASSNINQLSSYDLQSKTACTLKTIQIRFEELGLAYLIIRPKEYIFNYCDGSCSNYLLPHKVDRLSVYALIQSMISKKNKNIPQRHCVPSKYSNDNFLLRQIDGSMEIYSIQDVIVKQCACL